MILLRRATFSLPETERRWDSAPETPQDTHVLLRRMERRGELKPLRALPYIYQVTTPYADSRPIENEEILMEVHPYSSLSHLSALEFHHLTDQIPNRLIATVSDEASGNLLPPGTSGDDWEGIPLIRGQKIAKIQGRPVQWTTVAPKWHFGYREYRREGYPVRVMTPERTLLDGLRDPDLCGGIDKVLQSWAIASSTLNLDLLISFVEQFDIGILYQRVGFILDELEITDRRIDAWTRHATRGGSSKLSASAPYAPTYNERWNLSINSPIGALTEYR